KSASPPWNTAMTRTNLTHQISLFALMFALLIGCGVDPETEHTDESVVQAAAPEQDQPGAVTDRYVQRDVMITMRDGVRLHTEIYTPRDTIGPLPVIMLRSPYKVSGEDGEPSPFFNSAFSVLAEEDYIFVAQDARGRFKSEGSFVWNRPLAHRDDPQAIDASTDAYDTIDWLVNNLETNERVGMLGVSYPGWYVIMAMIDPHPALKAASPQASPSDYFVNDDFYHNGAFRLSPSAELPYLFDFDAKANSRFPYDQLDIYEFFLDLGPISNMNDHYMRGASPTWNNFLEHSVYDEYWQRGGTLQHLTEVAVPTLNVVGWWDPENLGGALDIYDTLEPLDTQDRNSIVVGPWNHGQWDDADVTSIGPYEFGFDTAEYYQRKIQSPWFAYWLKDEGDLAFLSEAIMYQTGSDQWKHYDHWPPVRLTTPLKLYFSEGSTLEPSAPQVEDAYAAYISDPANPVPYSPRPIMGFWQRLSNNAVAEFDEATTETLNENPVLQSETKRWKLEDQRFAANRPDVLTFQTAPLEQDIEVTGRIVANLFASTSGTDSDWVVKLIDVYPEYYAPKPELGGYQLMVADDVMRGKFRDSLVEPKPMQPNEPTAISIDLRARNHVFLEGHRIMVHIQSSWFPLIDRNPQKFMNIPDAKAEDFQKTENRIHLSAQHPSYIELPVVRP
ncbi:MAG: CocE/NonD family hydrolase, partial [Pseudomonadota bacterium]